MKLNNEIQTARELFQLNSIIRYNTEFRLVNESVAAHSHHVATIALKLYHKYKKDIKLDLATILTMALVHDVGEIGTGDIPYLTKKRSKLIKKELDKLELERVSAIMGEDVLPIYEQFERRQCAESLIVKMADMIGALVYGETEVSMGNSKFMRVVTEGWITIEELDREIMKYKEPKENKEVTRARK